MDLLKAITGKNPEEYEYAAQKLINEPDIDLFKKLVEQDDFLFDFVKINVSKRIQKACNKENYLNLIKLTDYYSASYDTVIAELLHQYGGLEVLPIVKELFHTGSNDQKAYATKFFSFVPAENLQELLPQLRIASKSDFEPLKLNSIEILSKLSDVISRNEAIEKLESDNEFEQYESVKFLVTYGAKDCLEKILYIMKKSTLAENIAAEIPYLINIEELLEKNFDDGILVMCNIVSAIPEIIPASACLEYNMFELFEDLYINRLTSSSALLLRMAKEKFSALSENDEYLYDCDKNTKDEIFAIKRLLEGVNTNKLNSLIYEELFDESDFVLFAIDYTDSIEELETLLDSKNPTLILKVLTRLKDKQALKASHKETALNAVTNDEIRKIIEVL